MIALAMTHETRIAQRTPDAEAYKVSEYFLLLGSGFCILGPIAQIKI
ncbi:hypothetical protein PsAD13_03679 [Pseudovibrio sp. Ad13]|nr:hypothetical protein PsAD13_03679 [Pseudovibrio sp. Ad13]